MSNPFVKIVMVHLDCGRGIISISKTVMSGYHGIRDNGRGSYSWPSLIDRMQEKEGCFLSASQHCYLLFFFFSLAILQNDACHFELSSIVSIGV